MNSSSADIRHVRSPELGTGALKLPNENFSRDKAIVKAIGKDPLVYQAPGRLAPPLSWDTASP